jgi:RHS repeat-associated protein
MLFAWGSALALAAMPVLNAGSGSINCDRQVAVLDHSAGQPEAILDAEESSPAAEGDEFFVFAAPDEQGVVDPYTGMFGLALCDLSVSTVSVALNLTRSYAPSRLSTGMLGSGWSLNWQPVLICDQAGVRILDTGGVTEFVAEDDQQTVLHSLSGQLLTWRDNTATRVQVDGTQDIFSADGKLVQRIVQGVTFTLQYDDHQRLVRIAGPDAVSLEFDYPSADTICIRSSTGDAVTYVLRENRLARVERMPGLPTEYAYDEAGHLARITHPQFGAVELTYNPEGLLTTRRWSDGSVERVERPTPETIHFVAVDGRVTRTVCDPVKGVTTVVEPTGQRTQLCFDRGGRIVEVTDGDGSTTRFTHDDQGRLIGVTGDQGDTLVWRYRDNEREPCGAFGPGGSGYQVERNDENLIARIDRGAASHTTYQYDTQGRPIRMESMDAPEMSLAYDAAGRVECIRNAAGNSSRIERDVRGNINRVIGFGGDVTCYTYDDQRRVISETDASGAVTQYEYTSTGLLRSVTDPRGSSTRYQYRGRSVMVTDPIGRQSNYRYDSGGKIVSRGTPGGAEELYEYDAAGNLIRHLDVTGREARIERDTSGRPWAVTDFAGGRTSYRYDRAGNVLETSDLQGRRTRYEYDSHGNPTKMSTHDGVQYVFEEGPRGPRAQTIVPAEGPPTKFGYDQHGNLVSVTRDDHVVRQYRFDKLDRLVEEWNERGMRVNYEYDALGNVINWSNSLGQHEAIVRDSLGRPISRSDNTGTLTQFAYDAAGNLTASSDPLRQTTRWVYDAAGQLTATVRPSGRTANYDYDADGHLIAARVGVRRVRQVERDAGGRPHAVTDALGRVTRTQFDTAGRLAARTNPDGQTTSYVYSSSGQLLEKRRPDGRVVVYRYDSHGNVTSIDDGEFPVHYSYDERDRLLRIEYPAIQRVLARRYDPHTGLLAEFVDSEGRHLHYRYDSSDRLIAIEVPEQGTFQFAYDVADRLVRLEYPNGVTGQWVYDSVGRLAGVVYQDRSHRPLDGTWYEYDLAGRPILQRTLAGQVHFVYDPDGRLIEEQRDGSVGVQFEYDELGARQAIVRDGERIEYTCDAAGQLTSAGTTGFQYDANGNLIARIEGTETIQYKYDSDNQLIEAQLSDGKSVRFGYAPTGERVWREDEKGRTYYVSDGLHVWAELDSRLQSTALYTHGPLVDRPLMLTRGEQAYFYHADALGSITALSNHTGKRAECYRYDAFGNPQAVRGASIDSLFRFTGREWDSTLQLYYYRARYYDPRMGRFLSVDTAPISIGAPHTLDAYAYVDNSPTRFVDPTGLQQEPPFPTTESGALRLLAWGEQQVRQSSPPIPARRLLVSQMRENGRFPTVEDPLSVAVRYPRNSIPIRPNTLSNVEHVLRDIGGPTVSDAPEIWYRDQVHLDGSSSIPRSVVDRSSPTVVRPHPHVGRNTPTVESPLTGAHPRPPGGTPTRLQPRPPTPGGNRSGSGVPGGTSGTWSPVTNAGGRALSIVNSVFAGIDIGDKIVNGRPPGELSGTVGFHATTHLLSGAWAGRITANLTSMIAAGSAPAWAPAALTVAGVAMAAMTAPSAGTQLGEMVVAHQQRQQIEERRAALANKLKQGEYVARFASQVAALEAKKRTSEFSATAAAGLTADAAMQAKRAESALALLQALQPAEDQDAILEQVKTLQAEAASLAEESETLADQVVQRLATEAPGNGLLVDSPQVAAVVSACDAMVEAIGGKVAACRALNEAIGTLLTRLDLAGSRLAQAEALLGQIKAAVAKGDALAESTRQYVSSAQGLRGEVLDQAPKLRDQIQLLIDQLQGVNVEGATALQLQLSLLRERANALTSSETSSAEQLPEQAAAHATMARLAHGTAMSVMDQIRRGGPLDMPSTDDVMVRAEAAHQRALAALLAFLSRIRSSQSAEPGDLADDTIQTPDGSIDVSENGPPDGPTESSLDALGQMVRPPDRGESDLPTDDLERLSQFVRRPDQTDDRAQSRDELDAIVGNDTGPGQAGTAEPGGLLKNWVGRNRNPKGSSGRQDDMNRFESRVDLRRTGEASWPHKFRVRAHSRRSVARQSRCRSMRAAT